LEKEIKNDQVQSYIISIEKKHEFKNGRKALLYQYKDNQFDAESVYEEYLNYYSFLDTKKDK
jgi:hypothetical protein